MVVSPTTQTVVNHANLYPYLSKILNKSKSNHSLKISPKSPHQKLELSQDQSSIGPVFMESPFILVPNFELLKLIKLGKCCSYCGDVLKVYDQGRMRDKDIDIDDSDNSPSRHHTHNHGKNGRKNGNSGSNGQGGRSKSGNRSTNEQQKHNRFLSGLDCDECESCWCSQECKDLDFRHELMFHRPTNKSMCHRFPVLAGPSSESGRSNGLNFSYEGWCKMFDFIKSNQLDLIYYGVMVMLHLIHDQALIRPFD
ncbi:unnamed protein product [Ambrosiozyma monospora]|uniref:Unnamed protein product n=1 Tax=Ambrosiozyma monospora TaxID=43982 RepID=A0A9W6WKG3_AMBMO|nr:unnamed protein product [Ambrosiozyma monospora]